MTSRRKLRANRDNAGVGADRAMPSGKRRQRAASPIGWDQLLSRGTRVATAPHRKRGRKVR